jgi:hypothetical protein
MPRLVQAKLILLLAAHRLRSCDASTPITENDYNRPDA